MGTSLSQLRATNTGLNLFESNLNDANVPQQERWSTHLCLVLLTTTLLVLVVYTGSGLKTIHVSIQDPSLEKFEALQLKYAKALKCSYSEIAIKYGRFLQMQATYHQVRRQLKKQSVVSPFSILENKS